MPKPSVTKIGAMLVPLIAAFQEAGGQAALQGDPAGFARDMLGEYGAYYTGFDINDRAWEADKLIVGWGSFAAAKAVSRVHRGLGSPVSQAGLPVTV